jgi:hypothetical protein
MTHNVVAVFYFCSDTMAYNRNNYLKTVRFIVDVYNTVKEHDVPDTKILRVEFPKRGINISYRTWMNIKNMKQSELPAQQLVLFG